MKVSCAIFGVGMVPQQPEHDAVNLLPIARHDFDKRRLVAGMKPPDELRIIGGLRGRSGARTAWWGFRVETLEASMGDKAFIFIEG
jgi:hypothetical protein